MEYKRVDASHILVRLVPGEEIMTSLLKVAEKETIDFAMIQGLGAVDEVVLGLYNVKTKEYTETKLEGIFEVISLTGTLDKKDGKHYGHDHICVGTTIGITAEIILTVLPTTVNRIEEPSMGINVWDLHA